MQKVKRFISMSNPHKEQFLSASTLAYAVVVNGNIYLMKNKSVTNISRLLTISLV